MDLKKLSVVLHDKREALGIPLAALARKASVGRSTLWTLERGENPKTGKPSRPAKDLLERLACALRLSAIETDELLTLAGYQAEQPIPQEATTSLVVTHSLEQDTYIPPIQMLIKSLQSLRQTSEDIRGDIEELKLVMRELTQQGKQRTVHPVETFIEYQYPLYYPFIIQDCLWNIIGENDAHIYMVGEPTAGRNLVELFFALDSRPMFDDWEQTVRRALWYFYISIRGLLDTLQQSNPDAYQHFYHEHQRLLARLAEWPNFSEMYKLQEVAKEELQFPMNPNAPFFACELTLMCRLSSSVRLRFQTIVQQMHQNGELFIHEALVPQNDETKAALILMHLAASSLPKPTVHDTLLKQAIWVLALLKTVEEGLIIGNLDKQWDPESALHRTFVAFSARYDKPMKGIQEILAEQIRFTLAELKDRNMIRKEAITDMIAHLDQRNFLIKSVLTSSPHLPPITL